jgi:hypothetical protein
MALVSFRKLRAYTQERGTVYELRPSPSDLPPYAHDLNIVSKTMSQMPPKVPKSPFTIPLAPTTRVTPMTEDKDVFYDYL